MTLNAIHHIAIICSDKDAALHFYHDLLGFPIIRSNYREGRQDWKIDLAINDDTELELFIMKDRPARVTNPEAYGLRHLAFKVVSVVDTVAKLEENPFRKPKFPKCAGLTWRKSGKKYSTAGNGSAYLRRGLKCSKNI